jgi:hypothetical protein
VAERIRIKPYGIFLILWITLVCGNPKKLRRRYPSGRLPPG